MPIGVPLIICGSIAIVGSGYAFKKLVYDPHLAHFVDAFIANHGPSHAQHARELSAPVPSTSQPRSHGITSALEKGIGRLRRRGRKNQEDEPLIAMDAREGELTPTATPSLSSTPTYEFKEQQFNISPETVLDDKRERVQSPTPHDDEIKSLIFNLPPSPLPPPPSNQTHRPEEGVGNYHLHPSPAHQNGPSTTFSFLSLSQVSSPEVPSAMLDSMTFSHIGTTAASDRAGEDVMSLPDTTSGYESMEGFSNVSSPRRGATALGNGGGLGLSRVEDVGMSRISLRRRDSLVSVSESEGQSDWEAISARST